VRNRLPIAAVAEQALRYGAFARAPAVAAQSALMRDLPAGIFRGESAQRRRQHRAAAHLARHAITTPTAPR